MAPARRRLHTSVECGRRCVVGYTRASSAAQFVDEADGKCVVGCTRASSAAQFVDEAGRDSKCSGWQRRHCGESANFSEHGHRRRPRVHWLSWTSSCIVMPSASMAELYAWLPSLSQIKSDLTFARRGVHQSTRVLWQPKQSHAARRRRRAARAAVAALAAAGPREVARAIAATACES